jgi:outer membrane receptor protein involved in Fe transport
MQKIYFLALMLLSQIAFSQSGTIKGKIKDEKTGEGIIGGNVVIEGTAIGASTDVEGNYEIPRVKAGRYNIVITYVSYKTKTVPNVEVYPDQTTVLNTSIQEDVMELESIVVTTKRQTDTDISVITELKKADLVAVGISSQQIRLSQDRDAAQVIRRVPGITIIGNRFVNVRGLSERYSTVLLNGIIAPSSEVDSKAFSFDLIPSNMLDRMLVYKSGSPELPGEFAGADISIYTKSVVPENYTSLSVSGSFRSGTTWQGASLSQEKGGTDWIGIDDGTRKLPSSFTDVNLRALSLGVPSEQNQLLSATKSLPNTWDTRSLTPLPDLRINLDLARAWKIGNKKIENITSLSYANTNQLLEIEQNYFEVFSQTLQKSSPRFQFKDIRFTQTNRLGAITNFTLELNPSNRLEFRNFYNQQGQNQSTFRTGTEDAQGFDVKNQAFNYFSRKIYSGQLSGKHSFSDAVNFNWILGYNNTSADQPDYRRIRSQRPIGTSDPLTVQIPSTASSVDAGRFYSTLSESSYTAVGNLEIKLNPRAEEPKQMKVIAGYYLEQKDRAFSARWFSNKWLSTPDFGLIQKPFSQIFTPENLGTKFILEEGTNIGPDSYDRYDAQNMLLAGYAGIVTPIAEKFRLSAGVRVENNVQLVDVYFGLQKEKRRDVDSPLTVIMPFFNLSYNLTEKMLVRLAYSKTVNRPVFRELVRFTYYDFDRNADVFGNPSLRTAKIDNLDLRWELYPSKAENVSVGFFYKSFQDPIEQYLAPGSNLIYSYVNADKATNYGVEVEMRKSLENLSSNFLKKLTFVFNGALITSKITLPANLTTLTSERPLQGQSAYVANASVYYNNLEKGWQVSLQYNVFGKRIVVVGDQNNPDQYELPRNQIDLTISKQLSDRLELKFGVQDILNQDYHVKQDSNGDKDITAVDETIQRYKFGQYTSLGIVWKF